MSKLTKNDRHWAEIKQIIWTGHCFTSYTVYDKTQEKLVLGKLSTASLYQYKPVYNNWIVQRVIWILEQDN